MLMRDFFGGRIEFVIDSHGAIWLGDNPVTKSRTVSLQRDYSSFPVLFCCDRRLPASVFLQVIASTAMVGRSPRTIKILKEEPDVGGEIDFIPSLPTDVTNSVRLARVNGELNVNPLPFDTIKDILGKLAAHDSGVSVVIFPGASDSVQDLVDLLDACKQVRLNHIYIAEHNPFTDENHEDAQQSVAPLPRDPQPGHEDRER
jgi:hypothetical protein